MSWFQLDASTIAGRVHAEGDVRMAPSLPGSFLRGAVGFTVASVAGFAPWAIRSDWLLGLVGEGGLFGICAAIFLLLSGPLLHRLIIGPDSFLTFYKLFSLGLAAYALAWFIGWTCLGGDLGKVLGLGAGALILGWMLTRAFEISGVIWKVVPALFVLSAGGYFGGGWVAERTHGFAALGLAPGTLDIVGRLLWGVCCGAGFGAGLGLAFYFCQADVREFLRAETVRGTS